jgi:hypothetical protein
MKALKSGVVMIGLLLLLSFNVTNATAEYLGEFCLSIHVTTSDKGSRDDTYIERIKITQIGDNAYNLQGIVNVPGDNPFFTHGSATVIGNDLVITQSGAQAHATSSYQDVGTSQSRINLSTMTGTIWGIHKSYNTSTRQFSDFYSAGTITLIKCP